MNIRRKYKAHSEVDTDALSDILFILVMFFLIVSTLANPNVVKVENPRGKSDTKVNQKVVISIDKHRQMFIGQRHIIFDSLESELTKEFAHLGKDTPVVSLNVDTVAYYGDFFRVLNIAKKLKAKTVANINPN
jgi:biopolymer transport protein ExbD